MTIPKKEIVSISKNESFVNNNQHKQERCPDLNLDLRISPPNTECLRTGTRICFTCSLGLESSQDCNCSQNITVGCSTTSNNNGGSSICYDFLGLRNNSPALDYKSLEMMK